MQFSETPNTLLASACYLIDQGIDVNGRDERNRTPLMVVCSASPDTAGACAESCHALALKLLEKSVDYSPSQAFKLLADLERQSTAATSSLIVEHGGEMPSTGEEPPRDSLRTLPPYCCSVKDISRLSNRIEKLETGTLRTTRTRVGAV